MPAEEPIFTAAEIARALNRNKRRVQELLQNVAPTARKSVNGQLAPAWSYAVLPSPLRAELNRLRDLFHYRSTVEVLSNPHHRWEPEVPLNEVRPVDRERAEKLREALAPGFRLPIGSLVSDRARATVDEYRRVFGYVVGERQLHELIARTIERDNGAEDFGRLEIYLSKTARQPALPKVLHFPSAFPELEDALQSMSSRTAPTAIDRAYYWRMVVDVVHERLPEEENKEQFLRDLRAYLFKAAPFLAETEQALRKNLKRKLDRAVKDQPQALADRRTLKAAVRPAWWDTEILRLAKHARTRWGRVAQAFRELYMGTAPNGERFSQEFRDYFTFDCRSGKSSVPRLVRAAVRPMLEATDDLALGPKQARVRLPSIHRDWSDTAAGDFYTSDDVTVNHYWWEESEEGEYEFDGMRFNVVRGQWLPIVDERTDNPLSFLLLPSPQYSSWAIHTLNARTFLDEMVGLPFVGMKYERGIWKARNIASQFDWSKIHDAFAAHGVSLRLRHATTPKAKIIERVIGTAQNLMDHLPGYVGRDEKKERHERVQKKLQSLKRVGQPLKEERDPRSFLLSKDQFADELVKVMRAFADEPQNGERLAGLSPAEAWRQLSPSRPHVVLPDSLSYLLSTHQSEQTVTSEGIKLRIGRQVNFYVGSEKLGALRGEKVKVFYNPELPEQVIVIHPASDPKGLAPFSVPLFQRVLANTASPEAFAEAKRHQRAFAQYGRAAFRLIAPRQNLTLRRENLGPAELRETGDRLQKLEREHIDLQSTRKRHAGEIREMASRHGLAIDPAKVRNPERVMEALRGNDDQKPLDDLEAEILRMEAEEDAREAALQATNDATTEASA